MAPQNGATEIKPSDLDTTTALDAIFEVLTQLQESVEELKTTLAETNEKLANLTLDNDGFNSFDED